jgi:hypothetical protein
MDHYHPDFNCFLFASCQDNFLSILKQMSIYIIQKDLPKDMYELSSLGQNLEPMTEIFYGLDTALVQSGFTSKSPKHCSKRIYEFGVATQNPHIGSSFSSFEHEMEKSRPE